MTVVLTEACDAGQLTSGDQATTRRVEDLPGAEVTTDIAPAEQRREPRTAIDEATDDRVSIRMGVRVHGGCIAPPRPAARRVVDRVAFSTGPPEIEPTARDVVDLLDRTLAD